MSFANFDGDFAEIFTNLGVNYKEYQEVFKASILSFILWANNMHTRMGQTSYYVTLCVGLGTTDFARFITSTILDCFYISGNLVYKPNIVFKVAAGINRYKEDKNYDNFEDLILASKNFSLNTLTILLLNFKPPLNFFVSCLLISYPPI